MTNNCANCTNKDETVSKPLDNIAPLEYNVRVDTSRSATLLDVSDLEEIFKGVGKNQIYELMRDKGFPSFKLGRKWFVEVRLFNKWLAQQPRFGK